MPTRALLTLMTMSLIAGCQHTIERIDTSCSWVRPITTTASERKVMTRETKIQILAHNDLYDSRCGTQSKEQ